MKIQIHNIEGKNGKYLIRTGRELNTMYNFHLLQNNTEYYNVPVEEHLRSGEVIVYRRDGDGTLDIHLVQDNSRVSFLEGTCNVTIEELWRQL